MQGNTRVYGTGLREPSANLLAVIGELRQLLAASEGKVAKLERQLEDRNERLKAISVLVHLDGRVSATKVVIARRSSPARLPGISAARRLAEGTGEHETHRTSADDFDFGDTEVVDPEAIEAFR
jgi:hypothetical protein